MSTALHDAVTGPTGPKQTASGLSGSLNRLAVLVGAAVVVLIFRDHLPEMLTRSPWITPVLDFLELPLGLLVTGELLRLALLGLRRGIVKIRVYFKQVKLKVTVEVPGPSKTDDVNQ